VSGPAACNRAPPLPPTALEAATTDPDELAEVVTGALDQQAGRLSWLAEPVRRVRGRVALG
jgi:hypothetical protein